MRAGAGVSPSQTLRRPSADGLSLGAGTLYKLAFLFSCGEGSVVNRCSIRQCLLLCTRACICDVNRNRRRVKRGSWTHCPEHSRGISSPSARNTWSEFGCKVAVVNSAAVVAKDVQCICVLHRNSLDRNPFTFALSLQVRTGARWCPKLLQRSRRSGTIAEATTHGEATRVDGCADQPSL